MASANSRRWPLLFAVTYCLVTYGVMMGAQTTPEASVLAARAKAEAGIVAQSSALPDTEGKGLVLATCTQCHGLGSIVAQRKSLEGWQMTVRDMVSRGAQVRPQEIAMISDYLARSFGPGAPATDAGSKQAAALGPEPGSQGSGSPAPSLPEGPARALILSSCTECHGLNKITEQRKEEPGWRAAVNDMVRLGAKLKPDEAQAVISYLASNFRLQREAVGSAVVSAAGSSRPADLSRMLPDGEGKGLILATCVQCHGLQEIVGQRKDAEGWRGTVQDMVSRGAQITPEEAGLIASYLARSMAK